MLPGDATIPAVHADRERFAEVTGRRAVAIAAEDLRPTRILTEDAFHNALVTLQALGGSTNGLVHVTAAANRVGIAVDLDDFDAIGRRLLVLVDLKPSGDHYPATGSVSMSRNAVSICGCPRPSLRRGASGGRLPCPTPARTAATSACTSTP